MSNENTRQLSILEAYQSMYQAEPTPVVEETQLLPEGIDSRAILDRLIRDGHVGMDVVESLISERLDPSTHKTPLMKCKAGYKLDKLSGNCVKPDDYRKIKRATVDNMKEDWNDMSQYKTKEAKKTEREMEMAKAGYNPENVKKVKPETKAKVARAKVSDKRTPSQRMADAYASTRRGDLGGIRAD